MSQESDPAVWLIFPMIGGDGGWNCGIIGVACVKWKVPRHTFGPQSTINLRVPES